MISKYGPFAPDQVATADILVGGKNVFPRPDKTYGPVQAFAAAYTALAARCQGAFYSIDSAGNTGLWAGTATKLLSLMSGIAFADVSKVGGYTAAAIESWEFEQLGQRVMAWNIADPIQSYVIGSSALFADLAAAAPKARHGGMVANFLLLGNTSDGTFGAQPDGLWWSAINDPTNWPTPATSAAAAVESGRINISGRGGWIQKVVPRVGTVDALIVQEKQISRCSYVGTPKVFEFTPMEGARGTPSPNSVVVYGGTMYYLGEDGYYSNDGTQSTAIGSAQIDEYFYNDVNQTLLYRVCAVIDPINKLYIVGYPSNASSGNIDKLLMYSIPAQQWAPPTEVSLEFLTRLGSVGYTLEQLDAFGTVDSIPTSFDSKFWMGSGKPLLAAFDTNHAAGLFSGTTLEAILETGDVDIESARVFSGGIRPLVQGSAATLTAAIGYRQSRNEDVVYSNYAAMNRELVVPFRVNARHLRSLVKIAAGSTWVHAAGVDFDYGAVSKL